VRALVTGGAGFIGSTLVDRLLAEDWEVDAVDDLSTGTLANLGEARSRRDHRFTFHRLDIRRPDVADLIIRRGPDTIFHLAAQASVRESVAHPTVDAEINIQGSLNVFEGAVEAGVRKIVFAGSGGTLYGVPEEVPVGEEHRQAPASPYGVSKKAVGDYLHYYRAVHGIEYTVLALANVYGPRQDPHGEAGVIAIFAGQLLEPMRPTIFGDGEQTRDFVYVDDVVDAFVRAADRGDGLLLNIGTGVETAVQDLFDAMARLVGFDEPARYAMARPGELQRSALDPARAANHLGWKPWTGLEDGLRRTISWFRAVPVGSRR
jgi:UDP-glucose 4-epimerase